MYFSNLAFKSLCVINTHLHYASVVVKLTLIPKWLNIVLHIFFEAVGIVLVGEAVPVHISPEVLKLSLPHLIPTMGPKPQSQPQAAEPVKECT